MNKPPPRPTRLNRLRDQPPEQMLALGLLMSAIAGGADFFTGAEISMSVFYVPGVALVAWAAGRGRGLAVAFTAAALWLVAELVTGQHRYTHPLIPYWNAGVRLAIFSSFALLLAELRRLNDLAEEQRATDPETGATHSVPFYQRVEREHAALSDGGAPFTLAYVDPGTLSLAAPGAQGAPDRVMATLRRVLRGDDAVARPRGREMAILLSNLGAADAPRALARIRGALAALAATEGPADAAISIGAVTCEGPFTELNRVIQHAYQLMYAAPRSPGSAVLEHAVMGEPGRRMDAAAGDGASPPEPAAA